MLTKSVIDRAKPHAEPYIVWDDELAGFGCKVFPSGKRSFVVRYRLRGSLKRYQPTIGTYGALTVAQARAEARVMLNAASWARTHRRSRLRAAPPRQRRRPRSR